MSFCNMFQINQYNSDRLLASLVNFVEASIVEEPIVEEPVPNSDMDSEKVVPQPAAEDSDQVKIFTHLYSL